MGRIPKVVKERAWKDLREQKQMKKEIDLTETKQANRRVSPCSSLSDRSIENYDPHKLQTGMKTFFFC